MTPSPRKRHRWFLKAALQAEKVYDAFHRCLARVTGRLGRPMSAEIYFAVRHARGVSVKGRVLLSRTWPHPHPDDPALVNFYHMFRRWCTPERPYSLLRLSAGGAAADHRADREGYFQLTLPPAEAPADELLIELPESEVSGPSTWPVSPGSDRARCLILSDVDDTVLVTHAAKILRMIATTFFGNALTRQLFPGVVELYAALRKGPDPAEDRDNPLAYVTSSPYNLHSLLELVFEENGLPLGPFFMTDWGLDEDKWLKRSHRDHKLDAIRTLLDWYPDLPVIMIGDTGQHDVAISVEAALAHPGRISLILIHVVSPPRRLALLAAEAERLEGAGTPIHFFRDYGEAAGLLAAAGWISEAQAGAVRTAAAEYVPLAERIRRRLADEASGSPPSGGMSGRPGSGG